MGKMSKEKLEKLKRENPEENNWELPEKKNEESAALKQQDDFGGIRFEALKPIAKVEEYADGESLLGLSAALLNIAKLKVDPQISAGNPIWHWALSDDHCTFIFKDGRKVRVEL